MNLTQEGIFVLRLSVVDENFQIYGYKLNFLEKKIVDDINPFTNSSISKKVLKYIIDFGIDSFSGGKPVFIPVNDEIIRNEFISFISKEKIYFELLNINPSFDTLEHLEFLKKQGFKFVIDENLFNESFLNCVDIVEINPKKYVEKKEYLINMLEFLHQKDKKIMAVNVNNKNEFNEFKNYGFDYFCGEFLTDKEKIEDSNQISPSKANLINLYNKIIKNPDITQIESIFKKSPDLSYKLLKLINSAYNSLSTQVSSIRKALVLLGLNNLKRWVLYMIYSEDYTDIKNNPYFIQALLRAKMMEKLCEKVCTDKEEKDKAYLVGLLSNLDVITKAPLEKLLSEIAVEDSVKKALLEKEGILGQIYSLILYFEKEAYDKVKEISQELNISISEILLSETLSIVEIEKSKF